MQTLAQQIMTQVERLPEGAPVSAKSLLHLGRRPAVDQALSRLVKRQGLLRVGRGTYVRPVMTRFGTRAPSAQSVVEGIASARGEVIARHGSAAANGLGLTTQVPVRAVYLTSGRTRQLKLGAQLVELQHASAWQLIRSGQPAGEAVRALAWLGPTHAKAALESLKLTLPAEELQRLASVRSTLPDWLAQQVGASLVANG